MGEQRRHTGRTQVAILNIKNLPGKLHKKLQGCAKRERRSVAQEVAHRLRELLAGIIHESGGNAEPRSGAIG